MSLIGELVDQVKRLTGAREAEDAPPALRASSMQFTKYWLSFDRRGGALSEGAHTRLAVPRDHARQRILPGRGARARV